MDRAQAIAAIRFTMGRRPSDPAPADPAAWLDSQLAPGLPGPALPDGVPADLPAIFAAAAEDNQTSRAGMGRPHQRRILRGEADAAIGFAIASPDGFRERLVAFWANHFTVARGKVPYTVGHFVREAIRPHVTGRFDDMLVAVVRHPAMLAYLDNQGSIGPNSRAGQRMSRGLNENLAREILELHTVTPAAGYTQADVTAFAKVLTGWSVAPLREPFGFIFREAAHEPGPKTVMGRSWPEGQEGGLQLLAWLGRHEATHRHLATKLVRHFVADDPPPEAIAAIFGVLRDSGGDLGAASRALVRLPQAWATPLAKLRSPFDYVVAVLRAVEAPPEAAERAFGTLQLLGQPLWAARAPNGWPDVASEWAAPEALLRRVEWASGISARGAGRDAADLAEAVLGPLCRPETLRAAARAGSAREALTLVLTSPEFHRR
ncbi:DUF1800 domain-containing protein [Roseomonas eburnea]|uniref:DUF1800 domain-containing protein n=1 Tax=Neoroseomonas eburnea TaxID=1346889 RepID=A0A9X9XHX4_9PROT|nr:DUF1800 domain-containing protein [Neoroseomonas eburnea]MBR0683310.1 DUF1800 domain-containing protein [Neoroseomonas eburnea]